MTLRSRLVIASGVCLVVVIAAFLGIAQRQERVLFDQLDTQLALVADRASVLASTSTRPPAEPTSASGEFYVGAVFEGRLFTSSVPASTPGLTPDIDDLRVAPRNLPVTIGTSDPDVDMRVIVHDIDEVQLVAGQSTKPINDAIESLRLSGLIAGSAIAGVALLVGWWVNRLSIQPIRTTTDVARSITAGRRGERVPESPRDTEAAALGRAMNLMLDTTAETEARLRSFVADASHELRTPLTTLVGYADMHRQGLLTSDEAVDDAMRRIRGEAKRMSAIVEHLLLLANLDEDTISIKPATVDIGQLLDDIAADARAIQPARTINVQVRAPVEVTADPGRLLQVVSILVTNALTHTPTSTALTLGGEVQRDAVVIRVTDAGPGIAPEHLARVFDRFYRVSQGRDRDHGGSGLGLAIAQSIATAHGGTLDVQSTVGIGSTFTLRLPHGGRETPEEDPGRPRLRAGPEILPPDERAHAGARPAESRRGLLWKRS